MGTSNVRLVKASTQQAPPAEQPAPRKTFSNWSRRFLEEYAAEQAAKPSARQQFDILFQPKEVN